MEELKDKLKERLKDVKHVVLVLSGKGGVGKSTVACQLAAGLAHGGAKVGLLDIDLCGPSIPTMLGIAGHSVHTCDDGWVPVYLQQQQLAVMSIEFLLASRDDAVVWRGPKKNAMIQSFLSDVCWGELDCLIVDTPPGTSDEHLAVVESLRALSPDGAVLVTTPQGVALMDVRREANFCKKAKLPILGVVENMSGFACPHCAECTNLFATGGGERLAEEIACPFLGRIPIDPQLGQALSEGKDFIATSKDAPSFAAVQQVIASLKTRIGIAQ